MTGRTTAQLLDVLDNLATGPTTTYYVWPVYTTLAYPADLCEALLLHRYADFARPRCERLELHDTGAVVCFVPYTTSPERTLRGLRLLNVVFDHACDTLPTQSVHAQLRARVWDSACTRVAHEIAAGPWTPL